MKNRLPWLDLLRGLAALLVVAGHLRAFFFPDYSALHGGGLVLKGFYFLTGLGHQAVMAFFVLSGFLVGGSVLRSRETGSWTWSGYLLRRLSRLWTVLIPALLLTAFWDHWGRMSHPDAYAGIYRGILHSGPDPTVPGTGSPEVFLGNLLFLQTILVPCFGTDSPLWSLANEFWYYLLFPLLVGLFRPLRRCDRVVGLLVLPLIFWLLPREFYPGFLIWILGALAHRVTLDPSGRRWLALPGFFPASLVLAGAVLFWSRVGAGEGWRDLILGCALLPLTATLALRVTDHRWFHGVTGAMSELSYTLYLVHFPFLAWILFTRFQGRQIQPDGHGVAVYAGLFLLVAGYSAIVWWCFERNTERIRRAIHRSLPVFHSPN